MERIFLNKDIIEIINAIPSSFQGKLDVKRSSTDIWKSFYVHLKNNLLAAYTDDNIKLSWVLILEDAFPVQHTDTDFSILLQENLESVHFQSLSKLSTDAWMKAIFAAL
ncbi:hypothetical protein GJ496_004117 [Pomphorhynchus laevis]|nr:hypothetical protein GJ496_004117 [Pomphorhynchus laevis]